MPDLDWKLVLMAAAGQWASYLLTNWVNDPVCNAIGRVFGLETPSLFMDVMSGLVALLTLIVGLLAVGMVIGKEEGDYRDVVAGAAVLVGGFALFFGSIAVFGIRIMDGRWLTLTEWGLGLGIVLAAFAIFGGLSAAGVWLGRALDL